MLKGQLDLFSLSEKRLSRVSRIQKCLFPFMGLLLDRHINIGVLLDSLQRRYHHISLTIRM